MSKEKYSENSENEKANVADSKKESEVKGKTPAKKSKAQKMWHRITHPNDKFHWF